MNKSVKIRFYVSLAVVALSLFLVIPSMWGLNHPEARDKMPDWLPDANMRLGLDLQGGVHMVMGVDLEGVVIAQLKAYSNSISRNLEETEFKIEKTTENKERGELELKVNDAGAFNAIEDEILANYAEVAEIVGDDVSDAGNFIVLKLTNTHENDVRTRALEQSIETIRNRIDEFGVAEPIISKKGADQILVQFPGADEPERLKDLIGQTAKLNFQIVPESNDAAKNSELMGQLVGWIAEAEETGGYTRESFERLSEYKARLQSDLSEKLPANTEIAFERISNPNVVGNVQLNPYILSTENVLSGEYIENAFVSLDSGSTGMGAQRPVVSFQMSPAGAPLLGDLTREFRGYQMAIVLDGIVKSAPNINGVITDSGQITLGTGTFDQISQEAQDLSIVLRAGALPASIEPQEERVIGPSMGRDSIEAGKNALITAGILIFLFLVFYYGWSGFIGSIATICNICIIFAILGTMGATLTLPGIAGIVLTMGMAVDALIIIFERMREELRQGRSTQQIIEQGFARAFSTILDSNVTTAIGAFMLLEFGTGSIRGFALTLIVGIVANVFTATFITRSFFKFFKRDNDAELNMGLSKSALEEARA